MLHLNTDKAHISTRQRTVCDKLSWPSWVVHRVGWFTHLVLLLAVRNFFHEKNTKNKRKISYQDCRSFHPYEGDELVRSDCPKRMTLSGSTGGQGETRMDVHKMSSLARTTRQRQSLTEMYWTDLREVIFIYLYYVSGLFKSVYKLLTTFLMTTCMLTAG